MEISGVTVFIIFLNLLGLIIVMLDELLYSERFSTFVYWAWLVVPAWGRFFTGFFFKKIILKSIDERSESQ